jgi:hypothetical protein
MRFTIQRPDLGKALAETEKDIERAVTSRMRDAADGLKRDLREDVVAAGLGRRLSRTWRGKTFPEVGESAAAAAPSLASKSGYLFCVRPSGLKACLVARAEDRRCLRSWRGDPPRFFKK